MSDARSEGDDKLKATLAGVSASGEVG